MPGGLPDRSDAGPAPAVEAAAAPSGRVLRRERLDRPPPGVLARQRFDDANLHVTVEEYLDQVLATSARRDRLDARIEQLAADSGWTLMVHKLGYLRGISTLAGFALAVEIGDG